jgi:hypothetical protein
LAVTRAPYDWTVLADSNIGSRAAQPLSPRNLLAASNAIRACWSARTSSIDDWSPAVASRGQCAVTALLIQELFGGELLRAVVADESHYWNRLPDQTELDLTRDQFDRFDISGSVVERDRSYVLSFPDTAERYALLRGLVLGALALDSVSD